MKCRFFYLRPFKHRRPSRFLSAVFSPPRFAHKKNHRKGGFCMVGLTGLEPATSSSRTKRSTRLNYNPKVVHMFTT